MSLPHAIRRTPALDRWIAFNEDGTITVRTGKVEIGQGITTAIAIIAAEELDVPVERIGVQTADTEVTPNEFVTAGSMSVEHSGAAVRVAAATARRIILTLAAEVLDVPASSLIVAEGIIYSSDSNEQTDYWSLQGGHPFGVTMVDSPPLKNPATYQVVGRHHQRRDLIAKVQGNVAFLHDMSLPGMRHGRLVKPPSQAARLISAPDTLDEPGITVVKNGSFLGVVAEREEAAERAAAQLAQNTRWTSTELTPLPDEIPAYLRANVTRSLAVREGIPIDESPHPPSTVPEATRTLQASYYRPYQMHGAMGPSAAIAGYMNGMLTVYSHSQGVELLKLALADVLDLPADRVHVIHAEGSGCYGHNGADDVALDAALLAMACEPDPVRVQWSRSDEHGFEPYGPATLIDMQASLDESGRIVDWRHETFSFTHAGRPRPGPGTADGTQRPAHTNLQTAWWLEPNRTPSPREPAMLPEVGAHRNLEPLYALPRRHLVTHFVADGPLRTSSLRSLGAFANVFSIESFMDELAVLADQDPIDFRLAHLTDERAVEVLETARDQAPPAPGRPGTGRGIALARYKNQQTWCAVVVDLHVTERAEVRLDHVVIAADAGLVIDPDGLTNQLEGGFIQAASWTLKEEVRWDRDGIVTRDWSSYPILTFTEVPGMETHLLNRPLDPALGAGEASTGPTPAAIANGVFAATGIRARDLPLTPDRLRQAAAL
jgi:CO/xanthine dehydrogenase Mo-binding subunit